jgi:hypothetical protein
MRPVVLDRGSILGSHPGRENWMNRPACRLLCKRFRAMRSVKRGFPLLRFQMRRIAREEQLVRLTSASGFGAGFNGPQVPPITADTFSARDGLQGSPGQERKKDGRRR